ncbi:hypothetical protein AGMMS49982_13090 [Bacteroidia bacterium]|nr:hypothetical protein AGMMS49982_13090 [Bacteroidia bacterium]
MVAAVGEINLFDLEKIVLLQQIYKYNDSRTKKRVPYASWWEDQRKGREYIAQSPPVTAEGALAQFLMLRNSKN